MTCRVNRELIQRRLSMKIGNHYNVGRIDIEDWRTVSRNSVLEEDRALAMFTDMGRALPDHISGAREQVTAERLSEKVVGPLTRQLNEHARVAPGRDQGRPMFEKVNP